MSGYSETSLAARFAALAPETASGDWIDVQRRSRRGGRRRVFVLAAAAALALLVVGSALAFAPRVIDFFSAERAPARVTRGFDEAQRTQRALWDETLPVVADEARTILESSSDRGTTYVAAAPRRGGGFCFWAEALSLQGGGISTDCVSPGRAAANPLVVNGTTGKLEPGRLDSEQLGYSDLHGYVASKETARLELVYEDDTRDTVPFVWVSEPIDVGFFTFQPGPEHVEAGFRATTLIALDASGRELARHSFAYTDPDDPWNWTTYVQRWPRAIDAATERVLVFPGSIPRKFRIAWTPDRTSFCYEALFSELGAGGGCQRPGFPSSLGIGSSDGGASLMGALRPDVASVVVRFEDGARVVLQPQERIVFYEIPPKRYARGRRAVRATLLDAGGRVLGRIAYNPRHDAYYGAALPAPEVDPTSTPDG